MNGIGTDKYGIIQLFCSEREGVSLPCRNCLRMNTLPASKVILCFGKYMVNIFEDFDVSHPVFVSLISQSNEEQKLLIEI